MASGAESGTAGVFTRAAPQSVPLKWVATFVTDARKRRSDQSERRYYLLQKDFSLLVSKSSALV